MMPTHKPDDVATMKRVEYERMRASQKKGVLDEYDVTSFPRAFSFIPREDNPKEAIYLGYELETYIHEEGDTRFVGHSNAASLIAKTKYGALCNFRSEYYASFEMVSIPATLNFHRKSVEELLVMKDFYSKNNNGMHVHVSKQNFKDRLHVSKFIVFINIAQNREFMERIAERKLSEFCAPNTKLKIRTKDKKPFRAELIFDEERFPLTLDESHGTGKHCAVNTAPRGTIELRVFKAPINKDKLISNLEFTEALVKFTMEKEINELTYETFCAYVEERKKEYKYLYKDIVPFLPKPVVKKEPAVKKSTLVEHESKSLIGNARQYAMRWI